MTDLQTILPCTTQHTITALTQERAYVAPHHALRESISHYTVYLPRGDVPCAHLAIVPDASGSIVCRLGGQLEIGFWGPSSHAVVVENIPEKYPLYIMVEFLPCGANRLLHIPMHELHNIRVPLETLDAPLARRMTHYFEKHSAASPRHLDAFLAALNTIFLQRLKPAEDAALSRHVISEIEHSNGTRRVADIACQLGYSQRQLARIMAEKLGMPTKLLARIIRINTACRRMVSPSVSLTELAHSLHYHDQSHFIHDFAAICGVTPGEYLQHMSFFYNEELKLGGMLPSK